MPESFLDFPDGNPIVSERAVQVLWPLIQNECELLPLECANGKYYYLNALSMVDALIEEESEIERLTTGPVINIRRYSFDLTKIGDLATFRLPQLPTDLYVTGAFVKAAHDARLTGLAPKLVWSGGAPVRLKNWLEEANDRLAKVRSMPISKILALPPQERLETLRDRLSDRRAMGESLESFTEAERTLLLIEELEYQVGNGGLSQYFDNCGDQALMALEGLRRVGASESASILAEALIPFGVAGPDPDPERRLVQLDALDSAEEHWDTLSERFMGYRDGLPVLKDKWVKANLGEFE